MQLFITIRNNDKQLKVYDRLSSCLFAIDGEHIETMGVIMNPYNYLNVDTWQPHTAPTSDR